MMTHRNTTSILLLVALLSLAIRTMAGDGRFIERPVTPQRVVWTSDATGTHVRQAEQLLQPFSGQVAVSDKHHCTLRSDSTHTASILLDFGKEIHGGLKIFAGIRRSKKAATLRITYGESVSEAMSRIGADTKANATNDHALRELIVQVPWLGSAMTGHSGFRFARIDLLDTDIDVNITAVQAISRMRDYDYEGTFECNDQRLNDIFSTAAYTVHLNMQEYIWDGIKRDRLVWLGDLNPEILTICNVFGQQAFDLIHRSLDFGRDAYPLPAFINDMSSYSLWWIINQYDLYRYEGNLDYLRQQRSYLSGLVERFAALIDSTTGAEKIPGGFLDWATSENSTAIHGGMQALAYIAMLRAAAMGTYLDDAALTQRANDVAALLAHHLPDTDNTQALSLLALSGLRKDTETVAQQILHNGLTQISTFYGYYALEALARAGRYNDALDIISTYWGKMLDLGATTFWEELTWNDVANAARIDEPVPDGKFDIHADGGAYCYVGLRASLCHGWASGPATWLMQHVLGVMPLEPGCTKLSIAPHLGQLQWAKGTFPTPKGLVHIDVRRDAHGKQVVSVKAPKGIKIVESKQK